MTTTSARFTAAALLVLGAAGCAAGTPASTPTADLAQDPTQTETQVTDAAHKVGEIVALGGGVKIKIVSVKAATRAQVDPALFDRPKWKGALVTYKVANTGTKAVSLVGSTHEVTFGPDGTTGTRATYKGPGAGGLWVLGDSLLMPGKTRVIVRAVIVGSTKAITLDLTPKIKPAPTDAPADVVWEVSAA